MSIQWVGAWTEAAPGVAGGRDRDGSVLYVARARHEESLIPGTWRPASKSVLIR